MRATSLNTNALATDFIGIADRAIADELPGGDPRSAGDFSPKPVLDQGKQSRCRVLLILYLADARPKA